MVSKSIKEIKKGCGELLDIVYNNEVICIGGYLCPTCQATLKAKEEVLEEIDKLGTKKIELNFDEEPRIKDEEWAYCGGCKKCVLEEGCTCGMISKEELKTRIEG